GHGQDVRTLHPRSFRGRYPMTRLLPRAPWALPWLLILVACTPLGMWLYEDPHVMMARVRVDADAGGAHPVVVALDVVNPNDYSLSATRLEMWLRLDGVPIGTLERSGRMAVPKGIARVALPLVPDRSTTPATLQTFHSGVHRFAMEGRATFVTPIGKRKVRFAQVGELAFGGPSAE